MGFLAINPDYAGLLSGHGLGRADDVLALPGVILGGHPDRHVARVVIGAGPAAVTAYLKRQHHVSWRERWRNAWAGFGAVSKSARELALLRALAGVGGPDWMAAGETDDGRAFVLVREASDAVELRALLAEGTLAPRDRRRLARSLGRLLARVHAAGFDHPDLYAKHVLVRRADLAVTFLDWQRTRRRQRVPWRIRARDLAALDATLGDDLASTRQRLLCLAAYLAQAAADGGPCPSLRHLAAAISRRSRRRRRSRRLRDIRAYCPAKAAPTLVWLAGEALCVTGDCHRALGGQVPGWLATIYDACQRAGTSSRLVIVAGHHGLLRQRRATGLVALLSGLCRRDIASPELRDLRALFRLQQYGIEVPTPLAVGQRRRRPWRSESFLITQAPGGTPLADWLARAEAGGDEPGRIRVLRQALDLARQIREAGCRLARRHGVHFAVVEAGGAPPRIVLAGTEGLRVGRRPRGLARLRELARWRTVVAAGRPVEADAGPFAGPQAAGAADPAQLCPGRI